MLTSRGSRFLMFCAATLALALVGPLLAENLLSRHGIGLPNTMTVALIALTLLIWFSWEWLRFAFCIELRFDVCKLKVSSRTSGKVESLSAWCPVPRSAFVSLPGGPGQPYLVLTDRVPFVCKRLSMAANDSKAVFRLIHRLSGSIEFASMA